MGESIKPRDAAEQRNEALPLKTLSDTLENIRNERNIIKIGVSLKKLDEWKKTNADIAKDPTITSIINEVLQKTKNTVLQFHAEGLQRSMNAHSPSLAYLEAIGNIFPKEVFNLEDARQKTLAVFEANKRKYQLALNQLQNPVAGNEYLTDMRLQEADLITAPDGKIKIQVYGGGLNLNQQYNYSHVSLLAQKVNEKYKGSSYSLSDPIGNSEYSSIQLSAFQNQTDAKERQNKQTAEYRANIMKLPQGREILITQDLARDGVKADTFGKLEHICTSVECSDNTPLKLIGGIDVRSINKQEKQPISLKQVADKIKQFAEQNPKIKTHDGEISIHALQIALKLTADKKDKAIVGPITYTALAEATKDNFPQTRAAKTSTT